MTISRLIKVATKNGNQRKVKLLGITIKNEFKVEQLISNIFKLILEWILFKIYFQSQFQYSPLMWMFHDKIKNNNINKLRKSALRLVSVIVTKYKYLKNH